MLADTGKQSSPAFAENGNRRSSTAEGLGDQGIQSQQEADAEQGWGVENGAADCLRSGLACGLRREVEA